MELSLSVSSFILSLTIQLSISVSHLSQTLYFLSESLDKRRFCMEHSSHTTRLHFLQCLVGLDRLANFYRRSCSKHNIQKSDCSYSKRLVSSSKVAGRRFSYLFWSISLSPRPPELIPKKEFSSSILCVSVVPWGDCDLIKRWFWCEGFNIRAGASLLESPEFKFLALDCSGSADLNAAPVATLLTPLPTF